MNLKSMMIIGMMTLCTVNTFGKTTTANDRNTLPHPAAVNGIVAVNNCNCKTCQDIRKKQKKAVNYCDCHNCKNQKHNARKCKVSKRGQKCSCKSCKPKAVKPQPVQHHPTVVQPTKTNNHSVPANGKNMRK